MTDLEKKYKNINREYGSEGRNLYFCEFCDCKTLTIHEVKGVTPFLINCPKCGNLAKSSMYTISQQGLFLGYDFMRIWYRPTLKELKKFKNPSAVEHVLNGGLMLKKQ